MQRARPKVRVIELQRGRIAIRFASDLTQHAVATANIGKYHSRTQLAPGEVRERELDEDYRTRCRCDHAASSSGRFQSAANPADPKGTSDEAAAVKDTSGQPVANHARDIWVTETALTTALNTSYMAEQLSVFGIVVGLALLLTGVGLMILAVAVLGERFRKEAAARAGVATKVAVGH